MEQLPLFFSNSETPQNGVRLAHQGDDYDNSIDRFKSSIGDADFCNVLIDSSTWFGLGFEEISCLQVSSGISIHELLRQISIVETLYTNIKVMSWVLWVINADLKVLSKVFSGDVAKVKPKDIDLEYYMLKVTNIVWLCKTLEAFCSRCASVVSVAQLILAFMISVDPELTEEEGEMAVKGLDTIDGPLFDLMPCFVQLPLVIDNLEVVVNLLTEESERRQKETKRKKGYVYLVRSETDKAYYKIGKTNNYQRRIRKMGVLLPYEIEPVHIIKCKDMHKAEKKLHNKYAQRRVNGEWFALTEDDIQEFKSIDAM